MSKIVTFADANVLIAAARGKHAKSAQAEKIFADPRREFCATQFLELEVRPKAMWFPNPDEALYYELFFRAVKYWTEVDRQFLDAAFLLASTYGLGAVDATHAAAAIANAADEFITMEKRNKPLFRIAGLNVIEL